MRQTNNANLGYLTKFIDHYETIQLLQWIKVAFLTSSFILNLISTQRNNYNYTLAIYLNLFKLAVQDKSRAFALFKKFFWLWIMRMAVRLVPPVSTVSCRCRSLMWMLNFNFVFVCFEVEDHKAITTRNELIDSPRSCMTPKERGIRRGVQIKKNKKYHLLM